MSIHKLEKDWVANGGEVSFKQYLADRITQIEARLEIDPRHSWDGISTRNETISLLEGEIEKMKAPYRLSEKPPTEPGWYWVENRHGQKYIVEYRGSLKASEDSGYQYGTAPIPGVIDE